MGVPDRIGQLQPGFRADMVVVDQNPLDDLAALGTVRLVLQEGRAVKCAL
jgi:imidazolonepropionase-like amidohydrolase